MASVTKNEAGRLLKDPRVLEEIDRHLWIESEKAGYDIGFDKAKEDWLKNFSKAWMKYHAPESSLAEAGVKSRAQKTVASIKKKSSGKRRAKSYLK